MPKRIGKKGIVAILLALITVIGVASLAFFTDRASHSMQFTTAKFSAEGYTLTRTAPIGPFCADEDVTATLKESYTGEDDANSIISMKATWVSPDTSLSIFGNANDADNAKLSVGGTNISYKVSSDNRSVTFDLPKQALAKGTSGAARELTLHIPASFKATGRIDFTFEKVVVGMDGTGFTKEFSRTDLNAADKLDYSVKVGWAASSIANQNGKALMGYLTDKSASDKYGIAFEFAFNYTESPMKDFADRTGAKWSYYKDTVDRLTFVEGMTTIGDYAFPDFSAVKSVSFPASVEKIGLSAFDASGLSGTVTIPATVKEIKSLAFGNLANVNAFTFGHTSRDSLTLPDNTAAGKRNTGAFYVPTHVDTTVNSSVESILYGYKWHDGYDNRREIPTLKEQDTWFRTYTSGSDYTANLDEDTLETITFADYHMPVTGETSWDASDPSVPGTVTAFLSADKKSLILAGNGYGLIFANEDSSQAFSNLTALKTVSDTDLLDTRNATTMAAMFNYDPELANISVTTWNVSKVTNMGDMFYCCDSLPSMDLKPNTCTAKDGSGQYTAWNTAALKYTSGMFMDYGGKKHALTTVDTTGWDTSKLEDASYMFMECQGLTKVKGIENWDVSSLKDTHNMFQDCQGLQTINVANWKTTSLENTSVMFGSCKALKSIDISKWDMSKVTKSTAMFVYCERFTELTLPKSLVVIGERFAGYCPKLTTITFNHPAGTDIQFGGDAFVVNDNGKSEKETGYVQYTPVAPLGTKVVTSNQKVLDYNWTSDHRGYKVEIKTVEGGTMTGEPLASYNGRKAVVAINGKTITFTDTADEAYAYDGATIQYIQNGTAKTVTLDKNTKTWVMPVVDDKVTEADVVVTPKWRVTAIPMLAAQDTWQYNGTDKDGNPTTPIDYDLLETINIVKKYTPADGETSWDASANETVDGVEYKGKVTVYLSADKKTLTMAGNGYEKIFANPDSTWALTKAYDGMTALKKINGANILDTQLVVNAGGMLAMNRNLESIDVSNWNTRKIQNTSAGSGYYGMFMNCAKLKTIDVSKWNTRNMTEMCRMFSGCETVTKIDVSGWKTASCEYMNDMFYGAGITEIKVSGAGWDTGKLAYSYNMFKDCTKLTQIDLSTWDVSKLKDTSSMFENSGLTSIDLSAWDESIVTDTGSMFLGCAALASVNINGWNLSSLGSSDYMFSGCTALTELTIPASLKVFGNGFAKNCTSLAKITFLHEADTTLMFPAAGSTYGAFYVSSYLKTNIVGANTDAQGYDWAKDNRAEEPIPAPTQKGTLTYNSNAQTPSWSNYDADKMTMSGTVSGTNAGSYTATFTPKDGYCWSDKTETSKNVTWKIEKAPGSLSLSKAEAEIGVDATTTTFTVNRAGDGAISVSTSNSSIATASVDGTTVTVTKKGGGTATITVKVAEGTNYLAPADAACKVTCKVEPVLAASNTWYKSSQNRNTITKITLMDKYTPTTTADESWDASAKRDKSVMAYRTGTKIVIAGNGCGKIYANADSTWMFQGRGAGGYEGERDGFRNLETIEGIELLDTSKVTDMDGMFAGCSGLTSLDVTKFDTSNVTDMSDMFWGCRSLANLDVSNFDTSNVTDMSSMFKGSSYWGSDTMALTSLDVTKFDTSNVTDMSDMFYGCSGLTSLDVTKFDTSKVTDMSSMFNGCSGLTSLDVTKFDTSNVTKMSSIFDGCSGLTSLDVTKFDTSKVTDMRYMFRNCIAITSLDLRNFNTAKVKYMDYMFAGCSGLTSLDVTKFDTSNVTKMSSMFQNCYALTSLDVTKFDTSNVTNMYGMFYGCSGLTSLDLSSFNTAKVTDMRCMFGGGIRGGKYIDGWCTNLREVVLGKDFRFVTDGNYPYYLPAPSPTYISGATGNWYVKGLGNTPCYTPEALAAVTRVRAVTYTAIPSTETGGGGSAGSEFDVNYPKQSGTLTYNGSSQSPSWSGYDSTKMTIGGTTSGTNAGSYTATFKPKDGYCWPDGTADTVSVTWKIGKATVSVPSQSGTLTYNGSAQSPAWSEYDSTKLTLGGTKSGTNAGTYTAKFTPTANYQWADGTTAAKNVTWSIGKAAGSLSISKSSATIGYDATTTSFTVDRAGDGKISVASNNANVATATVSGNTVTVTKKGPGTATITVKVAEGTNYTAPESKACTVTCKTLPILAAKDTWYKGPENMSTIKQIEIVDTYSGASTSSWDASAAQDKSVMAYINGTKLIIAGNGYGKILANANSSSAFSGFYRKNYVTSFTGLNKLDTSNVTNMSNMFRDCGALTSLDLSSFNTTNVTDMSGMFGGCYSLTSLNLSSFNTASVTDMSRMFNLCGALTSLDVSGFDTSNVTDMGGMFSGCASLTSLDVSGFNTSNVTDMSSMFSGCDSLTSLDLSSFNTAKVTDMGAMFGDSPNLQKIYVSDLWTTANVEFSTNMFSHCAKLSGKISYDSSKTDSAYANYTNGYLTYKAAP